MKALIDWVSRPIVKLITKSGQETIPQSVGVVTDFKFDKDLEQPALFSVPDTVSGDVEVVYWNGTSETVDCQFLSSRNMLVKRINSSGTTVSLSDIRLEI